MALLANANMPVSLLWLPNELYWRQNLAASPRTAVAHEDAPAPPVGAAPARTDRPR